MTNPMKPASVNSTAGRGWEKRLLPPDDSGSGRNGKSKGKAKSKGKSKGKGGSGFRTLI